MNNELNMKAMVGKKIWAVIGASPDTNKVSNRIYHTLKSHGYETYAINPKYDKMDDGEKCYDELDDLPVKPDCIDMVVPPAVTMEYIKKTDPKLYPNLWLQPGTYNDTVIEYAEKEGFTLVHEGACIMSYLTLHDSD